MTLIPTLSIQNFKCYRKQQIFNLAQSNFLIGANNAGKSAVLKALHCFFDDSQYAPEFINKTELRSRTSGYNKSTIGVTFDINFIKTKTLQGKLKDLTRKTKRPLRRLIYFIQEFYFSGKFQRCLHRLYFERRNI